MKRKAFRPSSLDTLEQRLVMSGNLPAVAHGPVTVGALGDSYSDEYQFYPIRNHARNWVEQLASAQKASFGQFTRGSRGEPRDQGYSLDWARSDATSSDMIANQLPGLTQQVAAGQVKYASIFVGANDFIRYLEAAAVNPPTADVVGAQLNQIAATVTANINQAVTTLLAANPNVKVVVATIPSVSVFPLARLVSSNPQGQALLAGVDQAVSRINAQIFTAGLNPRVAVSDLATQAGQLATSGGSTRFGGTTINLTTASNDYHSFFLADGLHVGTVGQGLIANSFINAIDTKFGARVSRLTNQQIVTQAIQIQRQTRNLLP